MEEGLSLGDWDMPRRRRARTASGIELSEADSRNDVANFAWSDGDWMGRGAGGGVIKRSLCALRIARVLSKGQTVLTHQSYIPYRVTYEQFSLKYLVPLK